MAVVDSSRDGRWGRIPTAYRAQEIKLGKLGVEGFDFKRFNKTDNSGLENTIPNSWVNSWIHTMYNLAPLRSRVLNSQTAKEVRYNNAPKL